MSHDLNGDPPSELSADEAALLEDMPALAGVGQSQIGRAHV